MNAASNTPTTWLRTDYPVTPINPSAWSLAVEAETALRQGVIASIDTQRPGFYEFVSDGHWYYVHIPKRILGVYLVAARESTMPVPELVAHQQAS